MTRPALWASNKIANTTDQQVRCIVDNTTAAGTGTAATPKPDDPQDVAAQCTAAITHTIEPTYGATPWMDFDLETIGVAA